MYLSLDSAQAISYELSFAQGKMVRVEQNQPNVGAEPVLSQPKELALPRLYIEVSDDDDPRWYLISTVVLFVSLVGLGVYTAFLQSSLSSDITDVEDRFSADLAAVDEKLSASIAEVEQELSTGIESLRTENTALLAGIGDVVASQILGEWSRDVPQQERIGNQFQALRESVLEPEGGAAS